MKTIYNVEAFIELRKQKLSYAKIAKIAGCSKYTVMYNLLPKRREQCMAMTKKKNKEQEYWKKQHPYKHKCFFFQVDKPKKTRVYQVKQKTLKTIYGEKLRRFSMTKISYKKVICNRPTFTVQDVIKKFGKNPRCALTGRKIKIKETRSFHFDHIIPRDKGGDNSIDNLQLLVREANQAKNNMTNKEFISLCAEVLRHNGFKIGK